MDHKLLKTKKRARAHLRRGALNGLSAYYRYSGQQNKGVMVPRISFPYLHAVPTHEEGAFRELVSTLAVDHTFISYSEAVRRVREGRIDRPYVSFSFDDGFLSNVRTSEILEEFGAVGMYFVPTGFIGTKTVPEARNFFGFSEGCNEPAMTWDDLERMKSRGHEIGNHTYGHHILAKLSVQQRIDQISRAAEDLRSRLGESRHFAWPYGRFSHFTDDAARAVFETGHESCASAERGAHVTPLGGPHSALCIRRDHIMTNWPLSHCAYFIARSGNKADKDSNLWPHNWQVVS